MFQFIGYSAFSGPDCLNVAPNEIDNITTIRLTNAIFNHMNVTKDTSLEYNTIIPTDWDYDTVLDVDFEGNLNASNVEFEISQISALKVKRREKGELNWLTLKTINIDGDVSKMNFTIIDKLNAYDIEYEYALVPVMSGVEGNYIIQSILSKFNGVFVLDNQQTFKFFYDVQYGTNARNQSVSSFTPLGKKYPVIVSNGILSYDNGTLSTTILNDDFETTGILNPVAIVKKKELLKDFLTNKKAKILKDWNGNLWLIFVSSSPKVTYKAGAGMKIPSIQFDWIEIGDSNNQIDLYNAGFLEEVE